jgi:hypothetical protein
MMGLNHFNDKRGPMKSELTKINILILKGREIIYLRVQITHESI